MNKKNLYLFGSQAPSLSQEYVARLRTAVYGNPQLEWIIKVVAEMPAIIDEYSSSSGHELPRKVLTDVQNLHGFFTTDGATANLTPSLSNTILSPLVIIGHLLEYRSFINSATSTHGSESQTIGLCTGMLSAFTVAASKDNESLAQYGAVALRLAILIGAIVDATEHSDAGPSKSFATAWTAPLTHEDVVQIANDTPGTYVAVKYDECRATITTPAASAEGVRVKLQNIGMVTTELGFQGRFHWQGHNVAAQFLLDFCRDQTKYHFPAVEDLALSTRSNQPGVLLASQRLHEVAILSLLTVQPEWPDAFAEAFNSISAQQDASIIVFGPERCVPPSLVPKARKHIRRASEYQVQPLPGNLHPPIKRDDIAIIGMSCKVPGAEGLQEFWDLLCKGQSQHREVPKDRFDFESPFRTTDPNRKWFGNFIDDYDSFDHRFFKKSPREASSTDPQQRQLLQSAYQAVQQSGYFNNQNPDTNVGCYIGVSSVDYSDNIACHQPNAYSAIGNLRGFIAGKISHQFGWTGPGLTIDTACSSSAVAIHQACQAIMAGECSSALAGGVHVMTSPLWFQNLAGASFLSPTGPCKPFDAAADGYCRGEGVATVLLKPMSAAIADGNTIFATIASSAVQQNENCTPIFVPNSPSLSDLFRKVTTRAQLAPEQITVVEAHGTGTPVGDPVEYNSVREVLGGSKRTSDISLGSVKGLIGHLECTSGIVSLIKIVLMMLNSAIPPQASFKNMNPGIKTLPTDHIQIATSILPWKAGFKAALINNYGASGSNASMVIKQASYRRPDKPLRSSHKYPFCFSAFDRKSLVRYLEQLHLFLDSRKHDQQGDVLGDISFNLLREYNRALPERLILTASSINELDEQLQQYKQGSPTPSNVQSGADRPIIFCFGGQSSKFVGLNEDLFNQSLLLKKYLEACDAVCTSLGVRSIFPHIFQRSDIDDVTLLHSMLFSLQYSCARAWMESGITPTAMVGHSFGELTALCVSGTLSLEDCLQAIIGRARMIESSWGSERGAMMAIEGDLGQVEDLLRESNLNVDPDWPANIACYNGLRQFTIAGTQSAIDQVASTSSSEAAYSTSRIKMLKVTHAYHSLLTAPLMDAVEHAAKLSKFQDPHTPLERATEFSSHEPLTARYFGEHMRNPVYFSHAVQRLATKYPGAVWLEAGSSSHVTVLAKRAMPDTAQHTFQELNITSDKALDNLAEATASLFRAGVHATFWLHHSMHAQEYSPLILPPYQFEKSRHWMELKSLSALAPTTSTETQVVQRKSDLLINLVSSEGLKSRFRIDTSLEAYEKLLHGHKIAQTAPICPATAQLDFCVEAIKTLVPDTTEFFPELRNVQNLAPVCRDLSRSLWLDIEAKSDKKFWSFKIVSTGVDVSDIITHTTGSLALLDHLDPSTKLKFARYERLKLHQRCLDILSDPDATEVMQGRNIYRAFSDVVDYGPQYQGLQKLVGLRDESAGRLSQAYNSKTWLDPLLSDVFCQVAGIYVNCMTDRGPGDMYLACEIETCLRSPNMPTIRPDSYHVLATHSKSTLDTVTSDVFVFDSKSGSLLEVILGIQYRSVKKASMQRILTRLTPALGGTGTASIPVKPQKLEPVQVERRPKRSRTKPTRKTTNKSPDILGQIKTVLSSFLGLDHKDILESSDLADLGVDSLMGMEMVTEIERKLNCNLPMEEVASVTTISGLVKCVSASLPTVESEEPAMSDEFSDSESSDIQEQSLPSTSATTPEERQVNSKSHIAQFLGVEEDTIKPSTILRDLGVDSLLAIELRTDLVSAFGTHLDMDVCLEDMSIAELDQALGGSQPIIDLGPQLESLTLSHSSTAHTPSTKLSVDPKSIESPPLSLPLEWIQDAFSEVKQQTDDQFMAFGCDDYVSKTLPQKTELCIALIVEALEKLGCPIRTAAEGDSLPLVECRKEQKNLRDYLYQALAKDAGLLVLDGGSVRRSAGEIRLDHSKQLLDRAVQAAPGEAGALQLIYHAGSNLADVLSGKTDGIKLIFGNAKGREMVSSLYGEWPINRLMYRQIEDFLSKLSDRMSSSDGTLRVLEMGAGTAGTSQWLIPLLAKLSIQVEYTFTDLAPSFVAAARKRFAQYDFIKYRTHDIEKPAPEDLQGSQHIVIASNAVHATHSITQSASHIRQFLRPDGLLMMVEMTTPLLWVDLIFGLFEGWWFFDDGRTHAVTSETDWKRHLLAAGYGSVDWTDGQRPENKLEKLLIATCSAPRLTVTKQDLAIPVASTDSDASADKTRVAVIQRYVQQMTSSFRAPPSIQAGATNKQPSELCVLVTGGSGSLGAHLVSNLVERDDVKSVICVNRPHKGDPTTHQLKSLISRGILVSAKGMAKLQTFEGDMTQAMLGLPKNTYQSLIGSVNCIVHNAWTMSAKRPIAGFEAQFDIMKNLISMASETAACGSRESKLRFIFISSIAVVGRYPLWKDTPHVPEERVPIDAVLPNGYGDAKWACELALDRTLHEFPANFATSSVRIGQIAGSRKSGYWNPMEHTSFLWKSSQTVNAIPNLQGLLSWTPVDDVAGVVGDLVGINTPYPIYNIDNPIRQAWSEMIPVLAKALAIPESNIIPFDDWVTLVRQCEGVGRTDNPASMLVDFLEDNFERMSCGGLLLATKNTQEHSETLRNVKPVSEEIARRFVQAWKDMRFLS